MRDVCSVWMIALVAVCGVCGVCAQAPASPVFRAYPHSAIGGVNLFESAATSPAACEELCLQHPECMSFEVGSGGCYGSTHTRLTAQEQYTYDFGYTLYERLDDPTHITCTDCSFKTANDMCGWVTLRDSDSCNTAIVPNKGLQPTCTYGTAHIESPPFVSAPYDKQSCRLIMNVFPQVTSDAGMCTGLENFITLLADDVMDSDPASSLSLPFVVYPGASNCVLSVSLSALSPMRIYSLVIGLRNRLSNPFTIADIRSIQCGDRIPLLTCPADVNATIPDGATVTSVSWAAPSPRYDLATRGHCDAGSFSCTSTHMSGQSFPRGSTQVAYACVDRYGLSAYCAFLVNVAQATTTSSAPPSSTTPTTTTAGASTTLAPCTSACAGACYLGLCYSACPTGTFLPSLPLASTPRTCALLPDAPVDVSVLPTSASSVRVSWRPPYVDKYIAGFFINYRSRTGGAWFTSDAGFPATPICVGCSVDYSILTYNLQGLYPVDYEINVQPYTSNNVKGRASQSVFISLKPTTTTTTPASSSSSSRPTSTTTFPQPWTKPSTSSTDKPYTTRRSTPKPHTTQASSGYPHSRSANMRSIVIASGVLGGLVIFLFLLYLVLRTDVYRRVRQGRVMTQHVDKYLRDLQALSTSSPSSSSSQQGPSTDANGDVASGGRMEMEPDYAHGFTINLDEELEDFSLTDEVCERNMERQRFIVIGPSVHSSEARDE